MNESLKISLDELRPQNVADFNIGGLNIDHSNTPLTRDEIGLTIRGESSHAETGFVIFLDVLGMKGIWERLLPRQVIKRWDEAIHAFMDSIEEHHSQLGVIPYLRALSDTIIITIPTQRTDSNIDQLFDLLRPYYSFQLSKPNDN